jgi:4-oxalocrotonate tautomerase
MPHIIVKMYAGRSAQEKARLTEKIVKDIVDTLSIKESSISVAIEDVKPEDWKEKVYKPDILDKWDKLAKKPGYRL